MFCAALATWPGGGLVGADSGMLGCVGVGGAWLVGAGELTGAGLAAGGGVLLALLFELGSNETSLGAATAGGSGG